MSKVDIIIPTFNQSDLTLKCFESIRKYTQDYRIIWIDNFSTPDEYGRIFDYLFQNPTMEYFHIANRENLGFVKATNQGIASSTAPFIVLMNNDTEAVEGWLDRMLTIFEKEPTCGIVGPLCSIAESWQNIENVKRVKGLDLPQDHYFMAPHMVAFFCTVIRREVIEKVGYLSEDFGIGLGDDDWYCEQVRRKGFKIFVTCNVVIPHHHRTTFRSIYSADEIEEMQTKARQKYYAKCKDEEITVAPENHQQVVPDNALKIFFAVGDHGGSGFIRIYTPAVYLGEKYKDDAEKRIVVAVDDRENESVNIADIVVMQRVHKPKAVFLADYLKSLGKKVVYELDDDIWHLPHDNSHKAFWTPEAVKVAEHVIGQCDAITVSTEPLADVVRKFNKNVHVLPNSIEFNPVWDEIQPEHDKIRIGWAGGHQHKGDLDVCASALMEIAETYRDKVQLVFMGMMPDEFLGIAEHYPFVAYPLYMDDLKRINLDIGVLPLAENVFNKSKSNIKFVDYSALHIASIASPVYPYATTIQDGKTGLIAKKNRHRDWVKNLTWLIEEPALRRDLAACANAEVKEKYNIEKNVSMWEKVYRGLKG